MIICNNFYDYNVFVIIFLSVIGFYQAVDHNNLNQYEM